MNNCRAGEGRGFVPGPLHLLHQLQEGRSLVWGLLIGPRGVPVMMEAAFLTIALDLDTGHGLNLQVTTSTLALAGA